MGLMKWEKSGLVVLVRLRLFDAVAYREHAVADVFAKDDELG